MIPLPTPPTDNFYKFLTISGILLFVASFAAYSAFWTKQLEVLHAARLQLGIDTAARRDLPASQAAINLKLDSIRAALQIAERTTNPKKAQRLVAGAHQFLDSTRHANDSIAALARESKHQLDESSVLLHLAEQEISEHDPIDSVVIGMMGAGMVMTASGLWLWYHRVQRYLDAALRRDSDSPPAPAQQREDNARPGSD